MNQYVLFYSYGCPKSKEIADLLDKNPFQDSIKMFCIDGIPILPNYIKYTPTLQIHHERHGLQYLIGDQIIDWLNMMLKETNKMANKLDQDDTIGSIDTAFGHQNDMNEEGGLDDMFKIDSGFNGETPRQGVSEGAMNAMDIEERMRQMQNEREILDNIYSNPERT